MYTNYKMILSALESTNFHEWLYLLMVNVYNTTQKANKWAIQSNMKIHMANILDIGAFQLIISHLAFSGAEILSMITLETVQWHVNFSQYIWHFEVMLHHKVCNTPITSFSCNLIFWVTMNYQLVVVYYGW